MGEALAKQVELMVKELHQEDEEREKEPPAGQEVNGTADVFTIYTHPSGCASFFVALLSRNLPAMLRTMKRSSDESTPARESLPHCGAPATIVHSWACDCWGVESWKRNL